MRLAGRCDGLQNLEKTPHFVHRCFGHNYECPPGVWRGICWRTERAGRAEWDAISRSSFSFRCSRCLTSGTIAGKTKGYAYVRRTNQPGPQRRMLVRQRQEVQEVPPRFRRAPAEHVRAGLRAARPRLAEKRCRHRGHQAQRDHQHRGAGLRGRAHRTGHDHRGGGPLGARLHGGARRHPGRLELRGLPEKRVHLHQRRGVPRHPVRGRRAARRRHRERGLLHHPRRLLLGLVAHVPHRRGVARASAPRGRDEEGHGSGALPPSSRGGCSATWARR